MLFAAISILTILGAAFLLSFCRFRAQLGGPGRADTKVPATGKSAGPRDYFRWLMRRGREMTGPGMVPKFLAWFEDWTTLRYPGWMRWVFVAVAASFFYLAASGFFFAVFIPRSMFGFPLLAHVSLGGVFAVGLALILLVRARAYAFDTGEEDRLADALRLAFRKPSPALSLKMLFWIYVLGGLLIIVSALASMLPLFPASAQRPLFELHRYSALFALLAAMVLFDRDVLPAKNR